MLSRKFYWLSIKNHSLLNQYYSQYQGDGEADNDFFCCVHGFGDHYDVNDDVNYDVDDNSSDTEAANVRRVNGGGEH